MKDEQIKMNWFLWICFFAFIVLRVLSVIFIEFDKAIAGSTDLLLVLITAVYAFSTHRIVQTSKDQICELRTQTEQMKRQHEQNIGVQKYERRTMALSLLDSSEYKKINTYDVRYLFNDDIFQNIRRLDFLNDQFDASYNDIQKFIEGFDVKNYTSRHFRDILGLIKLFPLKAGLREVAQKGLDEVIQSQQTEQELAKYLRSELDSLIRVKEEMCTLKAQILSNMEDIVRQDLDAKQ